MARYPSPLEAVLKGALAGALATVASYATGRVLFVPFAPPEFLARRGGTPPPHRIVQKFATGIFEVELTKGQESDLVWAVHFSYGAGWGVLYALLQSSLRWPPFFHGLVYGFVVWVLGHFYLLPSTKSPPRLQAAALDRQTLDGRQSRLGRGERGALRLARAAAARRLSGEVSWNPMPGARPSRPRRTPGTAARPIRRRPTRGCTLRSVA